MVVIENGEITRRDKPKPKADCSKCITDCRYKEWFEHEMRVKKSGCSRFGSDNNAE